MSKYLNAFSEISIEIMWNEAKRFFKMKWVFFYVEKILKIQGLLNNFIEYSELDNENDKSKAWFLTFIS